MDIGCFNELPWEYAAEWGLIRLSKGTVDGSIWLYIIQSIH